MEITISYYSNKPLFLLVLITLIISGIAPAEHFTWFLETTWVIIGLPIVYFSNKKFPLTRLLKYLLTFHALILIIGGYYTYAEVPLGNYIKEFFNLSRNHYDRLGHFTQGFVPAILAREILIRKSPVKSGSWLFVFVSCICLSFSAFFEMIEWWVSLAYDTQATAFLGTPGDVWDTQWDMFLCLVGALLSQIILGKEHDRELGGG